MTREEHLRAIYIVGSKKVGSNRTVLIMLCSGPECGGAEMFARCTAGDVAAEAGTHVDKMAALGSVPSASTIS